jgi:hypothetical protein
MEVQGVVVSYTDQSGVSKAGKEYKKAELVIKNNEGYNDAEKFIAFSVFGKSMSNFNHEVGDLINVFFDIESREYKGRYFTEAKAYQFRRTTESNPALNGDMANQFNESQSPF